MFGNYAKIITQDMVEDLVDVLPISKENAKHQRELRDILGLSTNRELRAIVREARLRCYPICSTTFDGYWLSDDESEILATAKSLKEQGYRLLETADALVKASNYVNS